MTMTSIEKPGTTVDKSGIVNKTRIFAGDVRVPLVQVENLLAMIRDRAAVSDSDTHIKMLNDLISVDGGISKTILNPGGDEQLQLSAEGLLVTIDEDEISGSAAGAITIDDISDEFSDWLLVASLRSTRASETVDTLITRVAGDATASRYIAQRVTTAGSGVTGGELVETDARLTAAAEIPAADSPAGSFGLFTIHLTGMNGTDYQVGSVWSLGTLLAASSGNIKYIAGSGIYTQTAVVDELNLLLDHGDFAVGSKWKLYGLKEA